MEHPLLNVVRKTAVSAVTALLILAGTAVSAMDLKELEQQQEGVQGLVILRIPFGGTVESEGPRLGLDLGLAKDSRQRLEPNLFDPETGQRLIQDDLEGVDTYAVDELLPALPSFGPILPESGENN